MIDHSTIDNLDQLEPNERAELLCPEIRAMGGDNGLVDALFGGGDQWLAELIAERVELQSGLDQHPDSPVYARLVARVDRIIVDHLVSRVLTVAEDAVDARLMQLHEDAQPGMTVEQEDDQRRARDMIAEGGR